MGIGIVLLFWAIAGTISASVGALVFGGLTALLTSGAVEGRRKIIVGAFAFPFICLGWAGLVFVFQAAVNGFLLQRDPGLGDTWYCPLPNGYAITMIDVTDQGWVYNPKTQPEGITDREDAISGVRTVQIAGRYILGAADSHWFGASEKPNTAVDSYFLLDTDVGAHTLFSTDDELRRAALQHGIRLNLENIDAVYPRYRFTWFDTFVVVLLLVPLLICFALLVRRVLRLRRMREVHLPA